MGISGNLGYPPYISRNLREYKEYLMLAKVHNLIMPCFCQEDFQALLSGYEGILPGKTLDFHRKYIFASSILDWPC